MINHKHVIWILIGALEETGGSYIRFVILIFVWIFSLVFATPMFQIVALDLDFEGAKNIHVLLVLIGALENAGVWKLGMIY